MKNRRVRYVGPMFTHGDPRSNVARKMLGILSAKLSTTNQRFGSFRKEFDDGSVMTSIINRNGPIDVYSIKFEAAESEIDIPLVSERS